MKKKSWLLLSIVVSLVLVCATTIKTTTAVQYQGYRTSIIDEDGLDIEVADVKESSVVSTEEYIKANIDNQYANFEKFEEKDSLYVKHLIAEASGFKGEKTIDELYNEQEDALIWMNDMPIALYDIDDNSDYYVAYADTMHEDNSSYVADYCFSRTNLWGQVISDAIYDEKTGLAYIPKKYTDENKNGAGQLNIQIELLQIVESSNPTATFNVKVEKDEAIDGNFASEGEVTVESVTTEFGIRVALDDKAKENINQDYFKVNVNGKETTDWKYYEKEGIIVISVLPSTIQDVDISISEKNVEENVNKRNEEMISTQATVDDIPVNGGNGVWIVNEIPAEGSSYWIEGSPSGTLDSSMVDVYIAFRIQGNFNMYAPASGWDSLVKSILNDTNVDLGNLEEGTDWIQHLLRFKQDINVDNKFTIPGGTAAYLKCSHGSTSFTTDHKRLPDTDDNSDPREMAWKIKIKIYKVTDDYMLVGFLTASLHNQAGTGLYKIAYTTGKGNLSVGKKDERGNFISGATLGISGPDGYYQQVTTEDHATTLNDLKKGQYTVTELSAPNNMVKNGNPVTVQVESNQTAEAYVVDSYQRGKVSLVKYDDRNRDNTQGDATVDGADYELRAESDIYEGPTKIYSANQTIAKVTTKDGGKTDPVTNLPIGNYYYQEVKESEGFLLNATRIPVSVGYTGQDNSEATFNTVEAPETPIYNSIEIHKYIGETTSSAKSPLEGAEFTATLKSSIGTNNVKTYKCKAPTDANGYCIIEDLPYGTYVVEETTVPNITLKCSNFEFKVEKTEEQLGRKYNLTDVKFVDEKNTLDTVQKDWLDENGYLIDEPKAIQIKMRKVDADRTTEAPDYTQGDGQLKGAIYQVYRYDPKKDAYSEYVYDITVDHKDEDGYWCAQTGDLLVGKYMVKEKVKSTETVDGTTYNYSYAKGYLVDPNTYYFEQNPETQTVKRVVKTDVSKEEIARGSVKVIKFNNNPNSTEEAESKGAILRLTLNSNKDIWYEVTIDENGYGEFIDRNDASHKTAVKTNYGDKYYPYTIPFGEYTITETSESNPQEHTHFYVQPVDVSLQKQTQVVYRIESDEPVPAWPKITKKDADTGETVQLEGAKFKIWDVANKTWVSQMITPSGEIIDEFETNAEGYFYMPQKLYPGEYVVYETQAPKGYYLEDSLRVPEDEKDLGNTQVSGKKFEVNKVATGLKDNTVYPEGGIKTGELVVEVEIKDTPLKGNIEIKKTGEKITGATSTQVEYNTSESQTQKEEKYTPNYNMVGLEGVTYQIVAAKDIKSPDGRITYIKAGEIADTITTGEDGIAKTKDLYLGEYEIKETVTPKGYLKDENIPNVTIENNNQYVKSATTKKELTDVRQKLELTFNKTFEDINFANAENPEKKALFGVYTKNAIKTYNEKTAIPANKLVDLIEVDENGHVTSTVDLPEGTYYVEELYVSYPYTKSIERQEFVLQYNGNAKQEFVVKQGKEIKNTYDSATVSLIKLSSSTMDNVILNGDTLDKTELDQKVSKIIDDIKGMTREEIAKYIKENNVKFVAGAKYGIYIDEECKTPLYIKNDSGKFEPAQIITDESGVSTLDKMPLGQYWLKELEAPKGYKLSDEVISITLDLTSKDTMIYHALIDDGVIHPFITKTDIFTGDVVPDCTFEIKDEDGNTLLRSKTDEKGDAYIPLDLFEDGKTYTYTEIEAPEIYKLNEEPHEFTAKFDEDGNWAVEKIKVENVRKESRVELTKLDMVDSTPIPNCKFELKSLETDFKVEGVTDENGIYVFENIPYGKYTYTELEAPEEYLIDTTPHEITIDAEDIKIVVKDERAPETGDIAVVALVIVAVVCVAGIVFVVVKNKKKTK